MEPVQGGGRGPKPEWQAFSYVPPMTPLWTTNVYDSESTDDEIVSLR
jgi:hypothetical protein